MALPERQRKALLGFSLLELLVVIALTGILGGIFLGRLQYYQEVAEKTSAELIVINIRAGLRYRVAEMLLQHKEKEIASLVGANPIKLLDSMPANYVGERRNLEWNDLPPGSWAFDVGKGELLYRVKRGRYFVPTKIGEQGMRFRINALVTKQDAGNSAIFAEGLSLNTVHAYQWLYIDN